VKTKLKKSETTYRMAGHIEVGQVTGPIVTPTKSSR